MIQNILSMMNKNFVKVDMFSGINSIQRHFYENNIKCFVVYEFNELVEQKKELQDSAEDLLIAGEISSEKERFSNIGLKHWGNEYGKY